MEDIFFNPVYEIMWERTGIIAEAVAAILAMAALLYTVITFTKSLRTSHYTELDSMYFDLLKTALEKPYLVNKLVNRSGNQRVEYDIYAFMVWNFLEAIYDRSKKDKHLCDTWFPIIDCENEKHREWFGRTENARKFKNEFHQFIRNRNIARES